MPRVKSKNPKSLKKLCAEFVASNLDRWCNASSENEINKCDREATLSQFDTLPSVLLEEVFCCVRCFLEESKSPDEMKLKKQSFELLITPRLTNLDLSIGQLNDAPYILNLASLRSTNLQDVKIVSSSDCMDMCVHLCAMKFESLQVLNISKTDAGDNCLQILGMYCTNLRELKVEYCKKITDAGIQGLCVSVNHLGKEDQSLGQCKSIESLFIKGTKITKKGIQTALINLPFLRQLMTTGNCDAIAVAVLVQFLAEIHQPDLNLKQLKDIRKYSLESLSLGDWLHYDGTRFSIPYTSGSLGLVASLCPSVTSVDITLITGLTDSDLLGLLSLANLNELIISNNANATVTFEGGVVPLLKGFGISLKVLVLSILQDVKIRAIIEFCPKLQSLTLHCNAYSAKDDTEPYHFERCRMKRNTPLVLNYLEKLCVNYPIEYDSEENKISSEDLLSLFSSPSLIGIDIFLCNNLTDNIFERASEIHQFLCLEKLSLFDCHSLTRRGIEVVMNNKTPLKTIDIFDCDNITDYDIALLISNARSEKWELSVGYDAEN